MCVGAVSALRRVKSASQERPVSTSDERFRSEGCTCAACTTSSATFIRSENEVRVGGRREHNNGLYMLLVSTAAGFGLAGGKGAAASRCASRRRSVSRAVCSRPF